MSNTYSQIYIQIVFAVKGRQCLIQGDWEEGLYKYITGIVQTKGQKMIAINGMPDHIHIFIGMKPNCCLSDLVREVKKSSNDWINDNRYTLGKFYWQEGFAAFSYSQSHLSNVANYIANQKKHHAKKSFRIEYLEILQKYEIDFKEEYLFEWYD